MLTEELMNPAGMLRGCSFQLVDSADEFSNSWLLATPAWNYSFEFIAFNAFCTLQKELKRRLGEEPAGQGSSREGGRRSEMGEAQAKEDTP